jgi:tetratricopeptide (TPR) repeat protein
MIKNNRILIISIVLLALGLLSVVVLQGDHGKEKYSAKEWFDKGLELYWIGKYEESVKAFDEALKIEPNNYDTWMQKGWALHELGKYKDALEAFNQSLKIMPDYAYATYGRDASLRNLSKNE